MAPLLIKHEVKINQDICLDESQNESESSSSSLSEFIELSRAWLVSGSPRVRLFTFTIRLAAPTLLVPSWLTSLTRVVCSICLI